MSTTIVIGPEATRDRDLAWAKLAHGIELTTNHKRLVLIELARRAHIADSDHPTCGDEWRILRVVADCPEVEARFADLVDTYDDWSACDTDVEEWRHRSDVVDTDPMSSETAFQYVQTRLEDAVDALVGA